MTPHQRPVPPALETTTVYVTASEPRTAWCPVCKAWTRFTGDVLYLDRGGVSVVGSYAGCEVCDEPDDRKADRV
ncbi:hypothetical protein ACFWC2_14565 [Streptomyces diastaticus]|uniref:hypothetical protein n=1 Tax=Streptomyces diastaticus TaxID=1956 RepID=UPI0036617E59